MRNYVSEEVRIGEREESVRESYVLKCPRGLPKCFENRCKLNYNCEIYNGRKENER